jgi:hypothetical protein
MPVALPHEVVNIHFQFVGKVLECAELASAGSADVGGKLVELGRWHRRSIRSAVATDAALRQKKGPNHSVRSGQNGRVHVLLLTLFIGRFPMAKSPQSL